MQDTRHQRLKIGEVAGMSGLPVKTIRYYEEIGLLTPTVFRAASGYRLFNEGVVERLKFIKRAQSLGLSLTEVKTVLGVHDQGALPCQEMKLHLQEKVQDIEHQIESLRAQRSQLKRVLAEWNENPSILSRATVICPNLQPATTSETDCREVGDSLLEARSSVK